MSHTTQRLLALLVVFAIPLGSAGLVYAGGFGPAQGSGGGGSSLSGLGSIDNAIVRTDGTGGDRVQGSSVTVDDSGNVTTAGRVQTGNGSSSAPAITGAVTNTGIYFHSGGMANLNASVSGTQVLGLDVASMTHQHASGATGRAIFTHASQTLSNLSGASVSTSGLIPAGATVLGVMVRVLTTVTGATSFDVGDGSDVDRYAAGVAVASGTTTNHTNFTADPRWWGSSARDVTLTANGSDFTGGAVKVSVYYMTFAASGF